MKLRLNGRLVWIVVFLFVFIWPGIMAYFVSKLIYRSKLWLKMKFGLIGIIGLFALFFNTAWITALVSPSESNSQVDKKTANLTPTIYEKVEITKSIEPNVTLVPETNNPNLIDSSETNVNRYKVTRVIDGDTIEIEGGQRVRYIGIDTPESTNQNECFGQEASKRNIELVGNKFVELEKDISETDRYGRLLRYVYVEGVMINELLVVEGYANSSSYPPDIKYQDKLREAESVAREGNLGLWSECLIPTPMPTKKLYATPTSSSLYYVPTIKPTMPTVQSNSGSGYVCNCSKTCANLSCPEAQYQLNVCGCSVRDGDDDGVACDSQCQ